MKIWIVDPNNNSTFYTYSQCNALVAASHEVLLITNVGYTFPKISAKFSVWKPYGKVSTRAIARFPMFSAHKWMRSVLKGLELPFGHLSLLLRAWHERPDIVHFHWLLVPVIDIFLLGGLRLLRIRISVTVHDLLPHRQRVFHRAVYRASFNMAHHLFVHSEGLKREAEKALGIRSEKFAVVYHGNFDEFANQENLSAQAARAHLQISSQAPVILFFGLIKEYKGLDLLINSLPEVARHFPDVQLIIAGKEYQQGDFHRYASRINELRLNAHVKLLLHYLTLREMDLVFLATDVVALPYTKSFQSGVIFNALSYGKPLVATDTGAFRETIEGDGLGIVVRERTMEAFARALVQQLAEIQRSSDFAEHARHISTTKYSWETVVTTMLAAYYVAFATRPKFTA